MRPPNLLLNTTNSTAAGGDDKSLVASTSSPSSATPDVKPLPLMEREVNNSTHHHHHLHRHHHYRKPEVCSETPSEVLKKYLAPSQFSEHFNVESDLGKGRFAVVRHCRCRQSGAEYAAKVLRKARLHLTRDAIMQEVFIHHRASRIHHRIARLMKVFEAPRELILILEYAPGGELWHAMARSDGGLYEQVVRRVTYQLLDVLAHIHSSGIIHCDINPHNILLTRPYYHHPDYIPEIRLCDFGLARMITSGQEMRDIRGTLDYVAPEVLLFDPIGPWSDIWSVGVLAYVLLSGFSPFAGATKEETLLNISRGSVSANSDDLNSGLFDDDDVRENDSTGQDSDESDSDSSESDKSTASATSGWATPGARDFICKLLIRNPKMRPTATDCLRMVWIRDIASEVISPTASTVPAAATNVLEHSEA